MDDATIQQEVLQRSKSVQMLLSQKKNLEALKVSLQSPPVLTKNEAIKSENYTIVMNAIQSITAKSDVCSAVESLSSDENDVLIKYIYKGLETSKTSMLLSLLLEYHSQLIRVAGDGCVLRALADRKTV